MCLDTARLYESYGERKKEWWRQAEPEDKGGGRLNLNRKKTMWYLCMGCESPHNKRTFLVETNSTNQRLCWWVGGGDTDVSITKPKIASNSLFVKIRRA